jgi:hypothetical protein
VPVVWQWQRYRDRRGRRGRTSDPGVAPVPPAPAAPQRVGPLADPEFLAGLRPIPSGSMESPAPWPAADIRGVSPSGDQIEVRIADADADGEPNADSRLLLAFLHTECDGCEEFWVGLRDPDSLGLAPGTFAVVVTKGPESLSPEVLKASAAGVQVPVVMSDQGWTDYRVLGYPFFVLVDRATQHVVGETVGLGWSDVIAMTGSAP